MPEFLTQTAPAKVNLALHVVGRRGDGYHLLESLAVFTRAGDVLSARPAAADAIVVKGRFAAQVPIDGANLVAQARDLMREVFGAAADMPVALELEKNLPVASGIGGGSSDAAAAMRMLGRFWSIDERLDELARLGLRLGADLPMCLTARPLVARGIGDEIEILHGFPALPIVLVNPGVPVATASVFASLPTAQNAPMPALAINGDSGFVADWLGNTRNDLQAAAIGIAPEIENVLDRLRAEGALIARMSGSGATCFGLFETGRDARSAAEAIGQSNPGWFVCETFTTAAETEAENDAD